MSQGLQQLWTTWMLALTMAKWELVAFVPFPDTSQT